jgi:hypothetical protein
MERPYQRVFPAAAADDEDRFLFLRRFGDHNTLSA